MTSMEPESFFNDRRVALDEISQQCLEQAGVSADDLTRSLVRYFDAGCFADPPNLVAIPHENWMRYRTYLLTLKLTVCLAGMIALDSRLSGGDPSLDRIDAAIKIKDQISAFITYTDTKRNNL